MSELVRIVAVVAVVGFVIARQFRGEPLRGRRVVVLPIVLMVIGVIDLSSSHPTVRPIDIACLVAGGVLVATIGIAQGRAIRLESRDGALWGQMPTWGIGLWVLLVTVRIGMTVVATGLHAHVAASSDTILLMLGINRLGQAAAIVWRAMASGIPFAPEKDGRPFLQGWVGPAPDASRMR
ncbi:MAG TPA: hypothetical protein VME70_15390 [Mycobacteriales bacterium]|nr:hypothetical protein [Mycobacteriales bacterium]